MTTTEDIPNLEAKEEEPKPIPKEKLDSLKRAREIKSRKAKELNEKELNIIHSLENIYNTLNTLDTRINYLDNHLRKRVHSEVFETETKNPALEKQKKKIKRDESTDDMETEHETDERSIWVTVANGASLVGAFIVARFASDYINHWARSTTQDKDNNPYIDLDLYR
jgi:hypothetical protein